MSINNISINFRKPNVQKDISLLTHVAGTLFYETFKDSNTEENMKEYMEQAFNSTQQSNELNDEQNYILFVETGWDDALEHFTRQNCDPERIKQLHDLMVHEDFKDYQSKKIVIAYCKLRHGSFEPCLKYKEKDTVELCRFYVLKEFHGTCVAPKLMEECLRAAREEFGGVCKSFWLGVWEHNTRAKRFYAKHKFEKVGEHVFVMGDDPQTDEVLELIL